MRSGPRLATSLVSKDTYCLFPTGKSSVAFRVDHFVLVWAAGSTESGERETEEARRLEGVAGESDVGSGVGAERGGAHGPEWRAPMAWSLGPCAVVSTAPYLKLYLVRGMTAALHCRLDWDIKHVMGIDELSDNNPESEEKPVNRFFFL